MGIKDLLRLLGQEIQAPDEETFDLFAQELPSSQNLGFIDSKAKTLELTVAGRDLTIHQSPGILSSSRAGGTTGAVVWKITPLFAEWISSPTNPLFTSGILTPNSSIIELGCGIAGIVALLLAPRVSSYLLTDQIYVAKLLEENITENSNSHVPSKSHTSSSKQRTTKSSRSERGDHGGWLGGAGTGTGSGQIRFTTLDWETDEPTTSLLPSSDLLFPSSSSSPSTLPPPRRGNNTPVFDVILACDCIYNEALVNPFVSTCADLCRLRASSTSKASPDQSDDDEQDEQDLDSERNPKPTICIVAQQLRDPSVFETFITEFTEKFHVWRIPDDIILVKPVVAGVVQGDKGHGKEHGGKAGGKGKGKVQTKARKEESEAETGQGKGKGEREREGGTESEERGLRSNSGFVLHLGILKGTIGAEILEALSSSSSLP